VITIIKGSTKNNLNPFLFQDGLSPTELSGLVDAVIDWTAGAPRPLLYALYLIQSYVDNGACDIKTRNGLEQLFSRLLELARSEPTLLRELGAMSLHGSSLSEEENKAYRFFCEFSNQGKTFDDVSNIKSGNKFEASLYLRSFNVFVKEGTNPGESMLAVPRFVKAQFKRDILQPHSVDRSAHFEESVLPRAYQIMTDLKSNDPLDGFRVLLTDDVVEKMLPLAGKTHGLTVWSGRAPKVNSKGRLTMSDIKKGIDERSFERINRQLERSMLGTFLDLVPIGHAFTFKKMSSSADCVVKVGEKCVIEVQCKNVKDRTLNSRVVQAEIDKSVVVRCPDLGYTSFFILLLRDAVETIVLQGGNSEHKRFVDVTVPIGMTLIIPSGSCVNTFFGEETMSNLVT